MSDDQIAAAMELKYGLGQHWKVVARIIGMDYITLRNAIYRAQHRGMRK